MGGHRPIFRQRSEIRLSTVDQSVDFQVVFFVSRVGSWLKKRPYYYPRNGWLRRKATLGPMGFHAICDKFCFCLVRNWCFIKLECLVADILPSWPRQRMKSRCWSRLVLAVHASPPPKTHSASEVMENLGTTQNLRFRRAKVARGVSGITLPRQRMKSSRLVLQSLLGSDGESRSLNLDAPSHGAVARAQNGVDLVGCSIVVFRSDIVRKRLTLTAKRGGSRNSVGLHRALRPAILP